MKQILVISNNTMARALVVAQRTKSDFLAGAKAMMIESLKDKLRNGIAHFVFLRKDGSVREAWGTTNGSLVATKVNGMGESRENYATTAYFDIEKAAWRSLRWESIVKVF